MNFLENKTDDLFSRNNAESRMELYTMLIYSSVVMERVIQLLANCKNKTKNYIFLRELNYDRLKVEQNARMRNMIFHLKQNQLVKEIIEIEGRNVDILIPDFFNSSHFWSPKGLDFAESFICFFHEHYSSRNMEKIADLIRIIHVTLIYQNIPNLVSLKKLGQHTEKFPYIKSFTFDSLEILTSTKINISYLELPAAFTEAIRSKETHYRKSENKTKINIKTQRIETEI